MHTRQTERAAGAALSVCRISPQFSHGTNAGMTGGEISLEICKLGVDIFRVYAILSKSTARKQQHMGV